MHGVASDYRVSQALTARLLGILLATLGATVLVLIALVVLASMPPAVLRVGALVAVAGAVVGGLVLYRRPVVVRLGADGYRVRLVRGAGVRQARWKDVEDLVATTVAGERCVVLRLRDGGTTTIPVALLHGPTETFVADLRRHLDRGHGYRRLG